MKARRVLFLGRTGQRHVKYLLIYSAQNEHANHIELEVGKREGGKLREAEAESVATIETMRLLSVISILALDIAANSAEIGTDGDGVRVLTEDNLDEFLSTNDVALVEFYSPSCARCRELRPEFARAARELAKFGLNLGKVNAVAETALRQDFNVKVRKQCFVWEFGSSGTISSFTIFRVTQH